MRRVADRDHPVEVGAGDPDHLVAWLSARLGRPVRAPSLDEYGYQLLGGRLLPGEAGRPRNSCTSARTARA